ncbi:hypothetical protein [Clostridium sp. BL-8]|uniref:DnaJ-like cysteine-rich domain-containing protein n=1 Tax=Clostridium sp. BL-8 TaxID=349938 RepID=UPI00098CC18F|nr:hypothetical protein [Clostridium sp. BL-8]OOM68611.1 hypothetical protein CLOBL_53250 [Clostridium sp. BL-8]
MKKIKKIISILLLVLSILVLNLISAHAEWQQSNNGWWYSEGSSYAIGWKLIDGNWYYFYSNGYMAHDTIIDNCYLNSSGAWIQNKVNSNYNTDSNYDWGLPDPNDYVNTFKNSDFPDYYTDPTLPQTDNTEYSASSSASSYDNRCDYCNGTGRCPVCHGRGTAVYFGGTDRPEDCNYCNGSGKCPYCNGSGRKK